MRLLVTRPSEDAQSLVNSLHSWGHEAETFPVLNIKYNALPLPEEEAFAFTSANGVRAFLSCGGDGKNKRAYAIGTSTKQLCYEVGFSEIFTANGEGKYGVEGLAKTIIDTPCSGGIVHICGRDREGDLVALLRKENIEMSRLVLYQAEAVNSFSYEVKEALRLQKFDAILFYSKRSLSIFFDLCIRAGLEDVISSLGAVCLSPAIASLAKQKQFSPILICESPTQDALKLCLQK